jgi:hypothetical protein
MTSNNSFFDPPILDNKGYFIGKAGGLKMNKKERIQMESQILKSQVVKTLVNKGDYGRKDTFTSEFSDE